MEASPTIGQNESMAKTAAMFAAAAVVTMIVLNIAGADGPIWILQGVFALAAAVMGFRAGGTSPKNTLAFAAFVVGTILFLAFAGFLISEI